MLVDTAIIKKRVEVLMSGGRKFGGDLYIDPCRFDEIPSHVQSHRSPRKSKTHGPIWSEWCMLMQTIANFEIDVESYMMEID